MNHFVCKAGKRKSGDLSAFMKCDDSGNWSEQGPVCVDTDQTLTVQPQNGVVVTMGDLHSSNQNKWFTIRISDEVGEFSIGVLTSSWSTTPELNLYDANSQPVSKFNNRYSSYNCGNLMSDGSSGCRAWSGLPVSQAREYTVEVVVAKSSFYGSSYSNVRLVTKDAGEAKCTQSLEMGKHVRSLYSQPNYNGHGSRCDNAPVGTECSPTCASYEYDAGKSTTCMCTERKNRFFCETAQWSDGLSRLSCYDNSVYGIIERHQIIVYIVFALLCASCIGVCCYKKHKQRERRREEDELQRRDGGGAGMWGGEALAVERYINPIVGEEDHPVVAPGGARAHADAGEVSMTVGQVVFMGGEGVTGLAKEQQPEEGKDTGIYLRSKSFSFFKFPRDRQRGPPKEEIELQSYSPEIIDDYAASFAGRDRENSANSLSESVQVLQQPGQRASLSGGSGVSLPEPGRVSLPEPGRVSQPEPGRVSQSEPGRVSQPEPGRVSLPEPGHVSLPKPGHVSLPHESDVSLPKFEDLHLPEPDQNQNSHIEGQQPQSLSKHIFHDEFPDYDYKEDPFSLPESEVVPHRSEVVSGPQEGFSRVKEGFSHQQEGLSHPLGVLSHPLEGISHPVGVLSHPLEGPKHGQSIASRSEGEFEQKDDL
eukprot:263876_1